MIRILAMINDVLHEKLNKFEGKFSEEYIGSQDRHEDQMSDLKKEIRHLMRMRLELEMFHAHLSPDDILFSDAEIKVLTDRFQDIWRQKPKGPVVFGHSHDIKGL